VDELEPTFTIIIPTLGRPSLWHTLDQIELVAAITEVIVVFEMGYLDRSELNGRTSCYKKVRFVEGSRPGVSANLNHGLELLATNYFGFFSDDDVWIPVDIESEIKLLKCEQIDLLLGASKMKSVFSKDVIRPKVAVIKPSQILDTPWWHPSPYYISLNNVIASSTVKNYQFKEDLKGYEDIEWLLRLEASGFKYKQNFTLRSSIEVNEVRNSKRDDTYLRRSVFQHLTVLSQAWAQKYILNISPRNHILAFNLSEIAKISIEKARYLGRRRLLKGLSVGLLQIVFSALLRLSLTILGRIKG
jgi:hypothetical protein